MTLVSYPRRQRNRRLGRALKHATIAAAGLSLAVAGLSAGLHGLAALLLLVGSASALRSRHWLRLARRSDVGARSEQQVRAVLKGLEHDGWLIRNSLRWHGGGDVDHVAIAPPVAGMAFAIETKTRTYRPHDLARVTSVSQWLAERHPRWCRHGAVPVLCLARSRGIERWEAGVAVVSSDRLVPVLSRLAGATAKPGFLR